MPNHKEFNIINNIDLRGLLKERKKRRRAKRAAASGKKTVKGVRREETFFGKNRIGGGGSAGFFFPPQPTTIVNNPAPTTAPAVPPPAPAKTDDHTAKTIQRMQNQLNYVNEGMNVLGILAQSEYERRFQPKPFTQPPAPQSNMSAPSSRLFSTETALMPYDANDNVGGVGTYGTSSDNYMTYEEDGVDVIDLGGPPQEEFVPEEEEPVASEPESDAMFFSPAPNIIPSKPAEPKTSTSGYNELTRTPLPPRVTRSMAEERKQEQEDAPTKTRKPKRTKEQIEADNAAKAAEKAAKAAAKEAERKAKAEAKAAAKEAEKAAKAAKEEYDKGSLESFIDSARKRRK